MTKNDMLEMRISFYAGFLRVISESNFLSIGGSRKKLLKFSPFERIATDLRLYAEFTCPYTHVRKLFFVLENLVSIFSISFNLIVRFQKLTEATPTNLVSRHSCRLRPNTSLREHGSPFPARRSTHNVDTDDFYRLS